MNKDIMRRLSIVRQLYIAGIEGAIRPSPLNALSLLPLHDAIEMFMQVATEHKGVSLPKKADFDQYWTAFQVIGIALGSRESMRRLNSARVILKHSGILPDRAEIAGFAQVVTNFLNDNVQSIFSIDFKSVSRAFLIEDPALKNLVDLGEAALRNSDTASSMVNFKLAFDKAIRYHGRRGLYDPRERVFSTNFFNNRDNKGVARSLEDISSTFGEAIMVVGYQLDFEGYRLLKTYSPVIHHFAGGGHQTQWMHEPPSADIVERCADFVVDTCIRLQETPASNR